MNIHPFTKNMRKNSKSLRLFLSIVILSFSFIIIRNIVVGSANLQLDISAPKNAEVNQAIEIDIDISNSDQLAGYELLLQFDKEAVEFAGLYAGNADAMPVDREIIILDNVPQGAAFALYTCQIEGCEQPQEDQTASNTKTANEKLETIRLRLLPLKPGTLKVELASAKFVGKNGEPIEVAISNPTVEINILENGATTANVMANDETPWSVPSVPEQTRSVELISTLQSSDLDRNRDGVLSFIDVVETTLVWKKVRQAGDICALNKSNSFFDVNLDGCLDIVDIQLMAMHKDSQNPAVFNQSRAALAGITFTVKSISDDADSVYGDGLCATAAGECTLRAAISEANAQSGVNSIHFDVPGSGVHTIQLTEALPTINDMVGGVTIDGFTQPGASENTAELANNSVILIEVKGQGLDQFSNFVITSPNNVLRGLSIYDSDQMIELYEDNAQYNQIVGNFIGTNAAGTFTSPIRDWQTGCGVYISQGANGNIIGTSALADRNVISGVPNRGIQIDHEDSDANVIQNNIMGLNPAGTGNLYNLVMGIDIQWGASSNIVGGTGFRERNVISGHSRYVGVDLSHSQSTSNNFVVGNFIGTDLTGTQVFDWTINNYGMVIKDDAMNNYIHDNVIAGSNFDGIEVKHNYNGRNYIYNNRIGVGIDGTVLGNGDWGIELTGHDFQIGPGNIFAGNGKGGINIDSRLGGGANEPADTSDGNRIFQNSFYDNGGLAIDIEPDGINFNDTDDSDTGANQLLNFPIIQTATITQIAGTTCSYCTVEVYLADSAAGNYGGGRLFLDQTVADSAGNFSFTTAASVAIGQSVTAIAIDNLGNTSEFSLNANISAGGPVSVSRQNLAVNRPTNQSSLSSNGASSRAVDSDTNGSWGNGSVTHTSTENQPWWEVDLEAVGPIAEIVLWNRTDCCSSRLSNVHVFVSDDPFTGDTVSDSQNQANVSEFFISGEAAAETTLAVNLTGRYVRVQLAGTNPLSLAEVQVFNIEDIVSLTPTPTFVPLTPIATGTPYPEIVPTQTPTPQPTTEANVIVADSFSRNSSSGWVSAETGGAYTHLWDVSAVDDFTADGSLGTVVLAGGGSSREANLDSAIVADSVGEFTFSMDSIPNATSFVRMQTRHVSNYSTYRATLQISSTGLVSAFVDRIENGSWGKIGSTESLGLQMQPNIQYKFKVETSGSNPTTLAMKTWPANDPEPTGWQHIVTDSTPTLQAAGGMGIRVNLNGAVSNGPIQYNFDDFNVSAIILDSKTGQLETVTAQIDGNWSTVLLDQTYDSPVVACSIHYLNNSIPVVVRLRNVVSDSFEIRLQNPGDSNLIVTDPVSCLVVEEGVWTLPDDRKIEAGLLNSTVTDHFGNWTGQKVNYGQSYSTPVVFGQVMTSNDSRWSIFWNRGSSTVNVPDSTNLYIGKEVGEDSDTNRLDETLGYIVIEAGNGALDSVPYEVLTGSDTVYDIFSPSSYTFNSAFNTTPAFGLVTQAAMDGGNGGWAYQIGANSLTSSNITLAIDEDQVADSERLHTNEQVSYFVAEQPISITWGEEVTTPVTPETVPLEIHARDDFDRIQYSTWGFGNMGGAYIHLWGDDAQDAFSVNGSEGLLTLDDNKNREANLMLIDKQDFDINFKIKTDQSSDSNQELLVSARTINSGSLYRLRVRILPTGSVEIAQIKAVNGAWTAALNQTVSGLTYTPGQYLNVRYQVVGLNPTTLRAKVWADGTTEPSNWQLSLTDSSSVLQTDGGFGFKLFNRSGSNKMITFSIDDLLITNVTELPAVASNRSAAVLWESIPSQGSVSYLPLMSNQSKISIDDRGMSLQDQR